MSGALLEQGLTEGVRRGQVPPARTGRRGRRWLGVLAPVVLLAAWQLASTRGTVSTRLLPAPSTVADALRDFFLGDSTVTLLGVVPFAGAGFDHLGASLARCAVSWALAVGVGVVVGLLLGVSRLARDLLDPVLNALRAVPLFAWLPLVLIWFGIGESSARALIFLGALWPVLVAVGDSTGRVPRAHVETARMLGTPRRDLWRKVYLPSALPEVVTGLRLSLTLAWTCVIVGELSGVTTGVGAMMNAARESGRPEQVVVGILVFATVGLLADLVLRRATARWVRWASPVTSGTLTARGVVKAFGELVVLDGVELAARPGEVLAVLGPSGCGKSTLLRVLAGFEDASGGEVLLDGARVTGPSPQRGMVAQAGGLLPWLSLRDNLGFGPRASGRSRAQIAETVDDLLRATGLDGFADALPKQLSGGMRQRAAIAQVLANRPPVLLLDEPFGALDAQTRLRMHEWLLGLLADRPTTTVLVTHDVEEALLLGDRLCLLSDRPARVVDELPVPFGSGRGRAVLSDPAFVRLKASVLERVLAA